MAFKITEICDKCKKEISEIKEITNSTMPVSILRQVTCKPKSWFICEQCETSLAKWFEGNHPKKSKYPKGA